MYEYFHWRWSEERIPEEMPRIHYSNPKFHPQKGHRRKDTVPFSPRAGLLPVVRRPAGFVPGGFSAAGNRICYKKQTAHRDISFRILDRQCLFFPE
jgi:hypothetical protein